MANSIITVLGNGSTTQYPLNFTLGILSRDYVTCRVGSEVDGLGAPVYRTLEWVTDGLVNIQGAVPGNNVPIVFKRTVPKDELQHDYSDGVPITEENLDESNLQTMMAIHEFLDGRLEGGFVQDLNMNGFKITNLGDGTDPEDAVNLAQLEDMTGNAPAYAAAAEASAASALANKNATDVNVITTNNNVIAAQAAQTAAEAATNGMKWRPTVRFCTVVNDTLSGLSARNGITPIAGDRILVQAQSTSSQNGVYIAAAGSWTRATDADSWSELVGQVVITEVASTVSGITDVPYICTVNAGGTLGVTPVTWTILPAPILDGSIEAIKLTSNALIAIRQIPQNSQSANYTFALTDGGRHVLHPSADTTARTFTIPANSSVAFPIGTAINIVNQNGAGAITVAITTDTLRLVGTGATGSRTVAANGLAILLKITSTQWIISGTGVT